MIKHCFSAWTRGKSVYQNNTYENHRDHSPLLDATILLTLTQYRSTHRGIREENDSKNNDVRRPRQIVRGKRK